MSPGVPLGLLVTGPNVTGPTVVVADVDTVSKREDGNSMHRERDLTCCKAITISYKPTD